MAILCVTNPNDLEKQTRKIDEWIKHANNQMGPSVNNLQIWIKGIRVFCTLISDLLQL